MKFIFLFALAAFFPVSLRAQQSANTSVCLSETPAAVLLNICQHERGMAPMPQPRLYLRIYKDGRGEYEVNSSWDALAKKKFMINEQDLRELTSLVAAASVENTLARYPVYHIGDDSEQERTVDIYADTGQKRIILTNFFAADRENKKHYPASLIALMEKVEEIWARANGIVSKPPSISFCTLMEDREYLTGKLVRIWANVELGVEEGSYLHDPECDRPEMGKERTRERIGYEVSVPGAVAAESRSSGKESIDLVKNKLGRAEAIRDILRQKGFDPNIPRVRVTIEGRLRAETTGQYHPREQMDQEAPLNTTKHNYPYLFIIERFLNVDEIVAPYVGELKASWTYSDAIDHVKGAPLKLSSPLKPMIHHAQLIEWTNADKFAALKRSGRKYLTFRVISKQTRQMERYRWDDIYTCELIKVSE